MRSALDLDYFSVATPVDVVMNGVSALGFAASTVLIGVALTYLIESRRIRQRYKSIIKYRRNPHSPARMYIVELRRERDRSDHSLRFVAYACLPLLLFGAILYMSRPPYLQIAAAAGLPPQCIGERIAWIGSQAIILRCGGDVHILRDTEHVHMVKMNRSCHLGGLTLLKCERTKSTSIGSPQASSASPPPATPVRPPAAPGSR